MVKSLLFKLSTVILISFIIFISGCRKSPGHSPTQNQTFNQEVAPEVQKTLSHKVQMLQTLVENKILIEEIINSNTSSKPYTQQEEIKCNLRWEKLEKQSPEVLALSFSKGALLLKEFIKENPEFDEIYTANKNGQIVNATGKNYIFCIRYQPWWNEVYNNGKGKIFIGKIRFDRSVIKITFPIYVPIYDPQTKALIGICNAALSLDSVKEQL